MSITYALGLRELSKDDKRKMEDNMHTNHEWDEPGTKDTYCIKCGNSFEVLELVADLLEALEELATTVEAAREEGYDNIDYDTTQPARKAIAKAKTKQ